MTPREDPPEFEKLLNGYAVNPDAAPAAQAPPLGPSAATHTPTPVPPDQTPAPTTDPSTKRALYTEYLTEQGYRFGVDDDGDLSIHVQGRSLCLFADDENDPSFFRLALPNFFECQDDDQTRRALAVANDLHRQYKVVKLTVVDGWVWASVEMFIKPLEHFRNIFDRSADLLCEACGDFRHRMKHPPENEPSAS